MTEDLPQSVTLQFDANGNLTNDGARVFAYDAENQLTNVVVAGQWREDFLYDGLNRRRITRQYAWQSGAWALTNETRFIYDGTSILQEWNSSNVLQVSYTSSIHGLLSRTDTNGSTFYHADGNKNITSLMDTNQYIVARYLYDPYGRMLGKWGTAAEANALRFSGNRYDAEAGVYYVGRRFYDPVLQRWLNQDPIGENGGINLYQFVANNPVNFVDPLGLQEEGAAELAADPTLLMDDNELAAYRAEQAAKKAAEEAQKKLASECKRMSEKELKKEVGDIHKAKDIMKKQFGKQLKGDKNFDVMVDKAGNVVLKGNQSGTLVPTGVPPSAFGP